jgi:CRP-like cAMP-binding protein
MNKKDQDFQELVRLLVPINSLTGPLQDQIIKDSEILTFRKRDYVFHQGSRDSYTYYLLEGSLELVASDQIIKKLDGGTGQAFFPVAQLQPRQMSAKATTAVTVLRVNRLLLDKLLSLGGEPVSQDGKSGGIEVEVIDGGDADWVGSLLQSELFSRVPASNISKLLSTIEAVSYKAGDTVVRQGDVGDYYYLIRDGRCEVLRNTSSGQEVKLAELDTGDSFGEEALVSDSRRNATVRMLTDGSLLRLTKDDFINLIKNPLIKSVTYEQGCELVNSGAQWLDVRFRDEHAESSIPDSTNVPLNQLRTQSVKLNQNKHYIAYCDTGSRSSVAAFLLTERGFDASYLDGGYMRYLAPAPAQVIEPPPPPPSPRPAPARQRQRAPAAERAAPPPAPPATARAPIMKTPVPDPTEADVRASVLKAELARAAMQLEEARRMQTEAEAARLAAERELQEKLKAERRRLDREADETRRAAEKVIEERLKAERQRLSAEAEAAKRAAEKALENRLREERERLEAESRKANVFLEEARRLKAEIEAQKRAAEQEAERQRSEQETQLMRLKKEAETRLQVEKRRLEELYRSNADELERIQAMKAQAEAALAADRKKLEVETRKQLEAAQAQLMKQQEQERRAREEAEAALAEERRKIETEFLRNTAMLELVQRERASAEAARRAAAQEAEEIISEYRSAHEQARILEQARLQEELRKLEEERRTLRVAMEEAGRAREEAETMQRRTQEQLDSLQQRQAESISANASAEQIKVDIQAVKAEADAAAELLRNAVRMEERLEQQRAANERMMEETFTQRGQLRAQLEKDLSEWISDHDQQAAATAKRSRSKASQAERIKRKAREARVRTQLHDLYLLEELATAINQETLENKGTDH